MGDGQMRSTRAHALSLLFRSRLLPLQRHDAASPAVSELDAGVRPAAGQSASVFTRFIGRRRSQATRSSYRTDIDGLRAIAVLAVILMHAGVDSVSGGFLGVDVFFVISGYLVHQQVAQRLQAQNFALFGFYGRRLRRTFPALYLVAAVSLAAGAVMLMPGDLDGLARSVIAAALGASNILFAMQTGYFDHEAITKPLLHSWSLGVEEQFYLIAPLISFGLCVLSGRTRRVTLVFLFAVGLVFCIVLQSLFPAETFFMMPPRLWEFLIGSLVAEAGIPIVKRRWIAEIASCVALALLLASMVWFSEANAHPGLITAVPCLATAALIYAGGQTRTFVSRLLGIYPLAFCGLISYSLYLWHWPLVVFARYADLPATPTVLLIGGGLLLVLSIVSWKFVETPFRDATSPVRRHAVLILMTGLIILLASASAIIFARGLPGRFPADVQTITSYYDYLDRRDFREGSCFITSKYGSVNYFDRANCLRKSATQPNYLLIGDSHAAHIWVGLSKVFSDVNIMQATASGCKPLLATHGAKYCVDLMHEVLVDFLPSAKLDGVIFAAAWNDVDATPLQTTLAYAERFAPHVIVLGNIPKHEVALPDLIGRSLAKNRPDLIFKNQADDPPHVDNLFKVAIDQAHYVSLVDLLCPADRCIVYASATVPLQFDKSHLTTEGSIFVAKKLAELSLFAPLVEARKTDTPE
ncbi:MAG: acyltransferase family protein [Beijerinckiaceae bacterium]